MYDYIIIGAGTAGCVMANRLTARSKNSVLLLEAGEFSQERAVSDPLKWPSLWGSELDWAIETTPQTGLDGRRVTLHAGKGPGGNTLINTMVFSDGNASGKGMAKLPGWDSETMAPYWEKVREQVKPELSASQLPLDQIFLEAAGTSMLEGRAGGSSSAAGQFGPLLATIHKGKRRSAVEAYLAPALYRSNLTVRTGVHAMNLLFKDNKVAGVRYFKDDEVREVKVNREIIICAGPIFSPQFLLLSGIGPVRQLHRFGVQVRQDLPGVGENLQDHPFVEMIFSVKETQTLADVAPEGGFFSSLWNRGPATNGFTMGGFISAADRSYDPDIQLIFSPGVWPNLSEAGYTIRAFLTSPASRGYVRLKSTDALHPPQVSPGYLEADIDVDRLRAGAAQAEKIALTAPLNGLTGEEHPPLPAAEAAREQFIRDQARPAGHLVGSCKMGASDDPAAVVDSDCRLNGIPRVRVVDGSILPQIPHGSPQGTIMAVAERAAALILGER